MTHTNVKLTCKQKLLSFSHLTLFVEVEVMYNIV